MLRFFLLHFVVLLGIGQVLAQSPNAASPAKSSPAPSPLGPPNTEELINSLNPADLQAAVALLKNNFTNPDAINETQLNRAMLEGLMIRLGHGLVLLPEKSSGLPEPAVPFYGELLEDHIGYLRPGTLMTANLLALEKKLAEFGKKVDALIIDLRASSTNDFGISSEFAKRFCPKGK